MKIKSLHLKNFRGYSDLIIPFKTNFTTIVGRNDVGKSTIFEALEIFFNNDLVKIESNDLNVKSSDPYIEISVSFEIDVNKEYLIDEQCPTSLREEYLLNAEGLLEIKKRWDCSKNLTNKSSLSTFIVANYFSEYQDNPLITLTISKLKELCKSKGLDDTNIDKRIASNYRKLLYSNTENNSMQIVSIPIDKEDAKAIYSKLELEFPYFALFQSDRANKDSDKEVQDPLKLITKRAISELESQLQSVVEQIKIKAIELGRQTIEQIKKMDPEIAKTLDPNVKTKNWDTLFSFSFSGDDGIPMNKRGSGVRRLILLNYFKAEAENHWDGKDIIYAIEEPETAQHPNYQVMLINALMEIAQNYNRQVMITTHSPEIAKMMNISDLLFLYKENNVPLLENNTNSKISKIKNTLGIMPYLTSLVVCVEGENDISFLTNIGKIPELKDIFDISQISIIPLIGGNLHNWVDRHYLKKSNVREFHIYDRDLNSGKNTEQYKEDVEKINNRSNGSKAVLTKKREMENYISLEIYKTDFPEIDWSENIEQDTFDFPQYIASKIKIEEKCAKMIINGRTAKRITKQSLESINAWEEIRGWFEHLKDMYEL